MRCGDTAISRVENVESTREIEKERDSEGKGRKQKFSDLISEANGPWREIIPNGIFFHEFVALRRIAKRLK